jgi:molecular chaperone GrpE
MIPDEIQENATLTSVRVVDEDLQPSGDENGAVSDVDVPALPSGNGGSVSVEDSESELADGLEDGSEAEGLGDDSELVELKESESPALVESNESSEPSEPLEHVESMDMDSDGCVPDGVSSSGESETEPNSNKPTAGPMLAELIATRAELRRVETERNDLLERLARRQADFENYRKRVERERGETYHRMVGDMVGKLLPVMDNMRRALAAETLMEKNESAEFRHFLRGVELIYKQLNDALEELGVEAVPAVGQPFDPHVHEAVATEHSEEYEPDIVTQELLRGYRLGEKLLRPAMVKVSSRQ